MRSRSISSSMVIASVKAGEALQPRGIGKSTGKPHRNVPEAVGGAGQVFLTTTQLTTHTLRRNTQFSAIFCNTLQNERCMVGCSATDSEFKGYGANPPDGKVGS